MKKGRHADASAQERGSVAHGRVRSGTPRCPPRAPHTIAAMNAFSTAPGASPHAPQTLPEPDAPARAISDALTKRIRARIAASPEGRIGFDDFMRMALYEPELG